MKIKSVFLAMVALVAAVAVSCKKETVLTVSQENVSFSAAGGTVTVDVTSSVDWVVGNEGAAWLTATRSDGKLVLTVGKNEGAAGVAAPERKTTIDIVAADKTALINVVQSGEETVFTVVGSPAPAKFTADGGSLSVKVDYNTSYTVNCDADWVVAASSKAVATDNLSFTVEPNLGDARIATITFKSASATETVTVEQEAYVLPKNLTTAAEFVNFIKVSPTLPAGETYTLGADIDLAGITLDHFAKSDTVRVNLDGQNHSIKNWNTEYPLFVMSTGTISNLVIDASCKLEWAGELAAERTFAFIAGDNCGLVKNCTTKGSINIKNAGAQKIFVAGVVARQETLPVGVVEGCTNLGNIYVEASMSASVSGIAGVVARFGNVEAAGIEVIKDCTNEGNVEFNFTGVSEGMKKFGVGGVAGTSRTVTGAADKETPNHGIVRNCTNRGDVKWSYLAGGKGSYPCMGGVVGALEGELYGCKNYGKLTYVGGVGGTPAATDANIGGVAGYVTYDAEDCHNYGTMDITGNFATGTRYAQSGGNTTYSCFGGVFGDCGPYVVAASGDENPITVKNCTNNADIVIEADMTSTGGPTSAFGGLVGAVSSKLIDCVNNGKLTVKSNVKIATVGGIAGTAMTALLQNCVNKGEVVFDGRLSEGGCPVDANQVYVGGVLGFTLASATKTKLVNCTNEKSVTVQNVKHAPGSYSYIGGVFGSYSGAGLVFDHCTNSGNLTNDADICMVMGGVAGGCNGTMTNCSNTGNIVNNATTAETGKPVEVGGFVGYINNNGVACDNNSTSGTITVKTAGAFIGGFAASVDKTVLTWTGNTANISAITAPADAKIGSVVGRARNAGNSAGQYSVTWKNGTLSSYLSSMPLIGFDQNGTTVVNDVKE